MEQPRRHSPYRERYQARCCRVENVDVPWFLWDSLVASRQVCRSPRWRAAPLVRRSARCGRDSSCSAMLYSVAMMCSDATSQRHFLIPGKSKNDLFYSLFLSRFIEMKEEEKKEKKIHSLLRNKRQCRWNRLTLINYYSLVSRSCKKRLNDISVEYLSTKLPILIKSLTRRINETLGQRKREANRLNTLFSLFRRNIFTLASMQSVDEHETYEQRSSG